MQPQASFVWLKIIDPIITPTEDPNVMTHRKKQKKHKKQNIKQQHHYCCVLINLIHHNDPIPRNNLHSYYLLIDTSKLEYSNSEQQTFKKCHQEWERY